MILLANTLIGVAEVLRLLLGVYMILIIAAVVLSWVNADPSNFIVRAIHSATDPLLYWLRSRFPLVHGGIDLSPILVFCLIYFLQAALVQTLFDYAATMRVQQLLESGITPS